MSRFSLSMMLLVSQSIYAYEMPVHARVTQEAFVRSDLTVNAAELFFRLGFDRLEPNHPFQSVSPTCANPQSGAGDAYIDANGSWLVGMQVPPDTNNVKLRCTLNYERRLMPPQFSGRAQTANAAPAPPGSTPQLRFEAWLMRGAIREDDIAQEYFTTADRPDADPWGDRTRVFNHFYNPVKNERGTLAFGIESIRWALGEDAPFSGPIQVADPQRNNHFSYADARRAYFQALTYKRIPVMAQPTPGLLTSLDSQTRTNLWATTLKSIGHFVHLMQDQASPQHSRSEAHNHTCTLPGSMGNQDVATRTYENFINYRLTNEYNRFTPNDNYIAANDCEEQFWLGEFGAESANRTDATTAWFRPYPKPTFSLARKFFTTRAATDSTDPAALPRAMLNQRAGLGDYANRGFYTQDNQNGGLASPPAPDSPEFVAGTSEVLMVPGLGKVKVQSLYWPVPDPVAPTFPNLLLVDGRAPIVSQSQWCLVLSCANYSLLSLRNYSQMADMLIPRAIGYSAGLIDFFFRGKLEIEPIQQRIFAVINQGEPHTIDADGYPIRTSDGKIFGFTKIRLKVRNITDPIIESGTGANVPQRVGVGKLVAVARYHRNACYKADLAGERQLNYSPPPTLLVDEPACPANLPTRTNYQEISVSAPQDILSDADLPGGTGVTPASLEKVFDFSMDPIPVNATDLFIQVVYRGQLGDETDGIAVGNYDLREPTFYAGWNNTDYLHNQSTGLWQSAGGAFPPRAMQGVRICAGAPSKLIYVYDVNDPQPGLNFPFTGVPANPPGILRLAFLFAKPAVGAEQVSVRSFPVMTMPASAQLRSGATPGQIHQASREIYEETGVNALPMPSNCGINPPADGANVFCFDPVLKRRGLAMGAIAQPLYYTINSSSGNNGPDVDAPPAQIPFLAQNIRTGGIVRFDDETPLLDCPAGPALLTPEQQRALELQERAWDLGVDLDAVGK